MASTIIRFFLFIASVVAGVFMLKSYRRGGGTDKKFSNISLFFAIYAMRNLVLAVSYYFRHNPGALLWLYWFSVLFFLLYVFFALRSLVYFTSSPEKKIRWTNLFFIIIAIALGAQICAPVVPQVAGESIIWDSNSVTGWLAGLSGFLVSISWAVFFVRHWPKQAGPMEKMKTASIILATLFFSLACLVFYIPESREFLPPVRVTEILVSIGFLFTLSLFGISAIGRADTAKKEARAQEEAEDILGPQ